VLSTKPAAGNPSRSDEPTFIEGNAMHPGGQSEYCSQKGAEGL